MTTSPRPAGGRPGRSPYTHRMRVWERVLLIMATANVGWAIAVGWVWVTPHQWWEIVTSSAVGAACVVGMLVSQQARRGMDRQWQEHERSMAALGRELPYPRRDNYR